MQRSISLVVIFMLVAGGIAVGQADQRVSTVDLATFVGCVRSLSWDMLGSEHFESGDVVTVKYLFPQKRTPRDKQSLYLGLVNVRGDFGRLFLIRKFEDGWWVVNDANFETKPKWKLSTEPLGGGNVASLMNDALRKMQHNESTERVTLSPPSKQPQGCSTYLQK